MKRDFVFLLPFCKVQVMHVQGPGLKQRESGPLKKSILPIHPGNVRKREGHSPVLEASDSRVRSTLVSTFSSSSLTVAIYTHV
jgi:hypothetical protein